MGDIVASMAADVPPFMFSPRTVIDHFRRLPPSYRTDRRRSYRKAEEAVFVSEMLAGQRAMCGTDVWLRIIGDAERSPDIKVYLWKKTGKTPDGMGVVFVEVTEYEEHSRESLVEFLDRTKLHKYPDDPELIILCRITRYSETPPASELKRQLVERNVINPILLCGPSTDPLLPHTDRTLIAFNPAPDVPPQWIRFNLDRELSTMSEAVVIEWNRRGGPVAYPKKRPGPFEVIGFVPDERGCYS